ncbi:MAG: alpha/beta fold hydrolase [Spirochaetales bacterium]|nr:alpha/beta fold hydrolase [Spirochaetales bacterium]
MSIATLIYKKAFVKRYDDDHIIHYFSYRDFPGMEARRIQFSTPQDIAVRGYIYSYPPQFAQGAHKDELVIFCHGMGGGHRSYMREIETICRKGYEVLAYDNVGCWESDGPDIRGLSESINDLVSCMDWLAGEADLRERRLHIMGHSWGGFAAGNILNFRQKNVVSVTVISSFASIDTFSDAGFGGKMKPIKNAIIRHERKTNPEYADACSVDAFKNTPVRCLILHSTDDNMAAFSTGLEYVRSHVDNPNVAYYETSGKFHNPNYTTDAVLYLRDSFAEYESMVKNKTLKTFEQKKAYMDGRDFLRMTEQDPEVWDLIFRNMEAACEG